ncbi:hypothetical protein AXA44_45480 [Rhodococcus sp. SC4]|nr:hypothetical protein AXA44_45480 [Rhodococcus sp. SC4]
MNVRIQRLCSFGGVAMIAVMVIGMLLFARFIPPPSPLLDAQAVADIYSDSTNGIRLGMLLVSIGAALLAPFVAMITVQMKRIEGARTPLSYIQLALGTLFIIEFIIPSFVCLAATYRPERSPEITQALNDLCWLMFVGVVSTAVLQCFAIAIAIFTDKSENPIFPRWAAYFNVWAALLFSPGGVVVFFKVGPLAWNGLFTWWLPLSVFGGWLIVMTWLLLAAVKRDTQEPEATQLTAVINPDDQIVDTRRRIDLLSEEVSALRAASADSL